MDDQWIKKKNKLNDGALFKISRFKEVIKKTVPHKHDGYYELIFLSEGEGFHWIETESYRVEAPEFYFLKPGQLHYWQFTSIPKGFVVLFREEYFDSVKQESITSLLKHLDKIVRVSLPGDYQPGPVFEEILKEFLQNSPYSNSIIHGYLQAIFSKLLQMTESKKDQNSRSSALPEQFLKLLSEKCPEMHLVNEYASLLHTTPQNLNAACRKYLAKSAGEIIAAQLILEAKRYILHTEKTIGEIAHILHFNDASYFVRFFKKHASLTPGQFREKHFQ